MTEIIDYSNYVVSWVNPSTQPKPYQRCIISWEGGTQEHVYQFCRLEDDEIWRGEGKAPDCWFCLEMGDTYLIPYDEIDSWMPIPKSPINNQRQNIINLGKDKLMCNQIAELLNEKLEKINCNKFQITLWFSNDLFLAIGVNEEYMVFEDMEAPKTIKNFFKISNLISSKYFI